MTRRQMLYLVGSPAAGKSTLMAALVDRIVCHERLQPVAHQDYGSGVVQLGRDRAGFPGTDTLSMSAIVPVLDWMAAPDGPAVVLAEGDRLATDRFFGGARARGYETTVVGVVVAESTLWNRRGGRSGWSPSLSWLKGRDTKSARLCAAADLVVPGDDLDSALSMLRPLPVLDRLEALRRVEVDGE